MSNLSNKIAITAMTLAFGLLTGCDTFSRPDIKNEPWDKPNSSDTHPTSIPTSPSDPAQP